MSKVNKTVVMRVTPDEAAKLRYQRKFDAAWDKEQKRAQADACITAIMAARQAIAASMAEHLNVVHFPPSMNRAECDKATVSLRGVL